MMSDQESMIVGLVFRVDGGALLAEFTPVENWHPIDSAEIRRALIHQELGAVPLDRDALDELIDKYGESKQSFRIVLGSATDAVVEVSLDAERMSAYLTVIPAHGGRKADREQVLSALRKAGVVHGVLVSEIDTALATDKVDNKLVAQGTMAQNGVDSEFKSLVPEIGAGALKVDEHGTVDYRELELFVTVKEGDPLMQRIPATVGTSGKNLLGEIIQAKPGKDYAFAKGMHGVKFDPRNYDRLLADIPGQPLLVTRGVNVEPTLSVKGIDLSTGNLNFEGSVNISTDVKSGMKIKVTGDLIIGGTVEAAEIHAGGNITIRGGIIGHGEKVPEGNARHDVAHISCGGTISARFVENAHIEAGDSIIVGEVVQHSELIASNHIVVGKDGARKGHIVGGTTRATQFIKAVVLGSPAGVRTEIETGLNPQLHSSVTSLEIKLEKLRKEKEELERALVFSRENPGRVNAETQQKLANTQEKLQLDIDTYEQEKTDLETRLSLTANARVVVAKQIFGGVTVHIGHHFWQVKEDRDSGTFLIKDGDITIGDA
jgi:hypothetical protein